MISNSPLGSYLHATVSVSIEARVGKLTAGPDGRNQRRPPAKTRIKRKLAPKIWTEKKENAEDKTEMRKKTENAERLANCESA